MERGYILHQRPYQESKIIANLLTDNKGRVDAVIQVGRGKRNLKSILQPFQPLLFDIKGEGDLKTLIQLESLSPAIPLTGYSLYAAMYVNELVMRLLKHGGDALYLIYHRTLMALAKEFNQCQLRYFEMALLQELGVMPSLIQDTKGQRINSEQCYKYSPEFGFTSVNQAGETKNCYLGVSLLRLDNTELEDADLLSIKQLMRTLITPLLAGAPLVSRQLFISATKQIKI